MALPNDDCAGCCVCVDPIVETRAVEATWSKCGVAGPDGQDYLTYQSACDSDGNQTSIYTDPNTCEETGTTGPTGQCCPFSAYFTNPATGLPATTLTRTWDAARTYTAPDTEPSWNPPFPNPAGTLTVTGKVVMNVTVKVPGGPGAGEACEQQAPTFSQTDEIVSVSDLFTYDHSEDPLNVWVSSHQRITQTWVKTGMDGLTPIGTATLEYYDVLNDHPQAGGSTTYDVPITSAIYAGVGSDSLAASDVYTGTPPYSTPTYEDPYTTEMLIAAGIYNLPAFSTEEWTTRDVDYRPYSEVDLAGDETMVGVRHQQFRFRFPVPRIGMGDKYSVTWIERYLPPGGRPLYSVEVAPRVHAAPGFFTVENSFRPLAFLTDEGSGNACELTPVMAADGSVASIRINNPGGGYSSAAPPTVNLQPRAALAGYVHTASTGWVATVENGQVVAVTRSGGTAGNYAPQLTIPAGGPNEPARLATCTCTLNPAGEIDAVTLTDTGAGYDYPPTVRATWGGGLRYTIYDLIAHFAPEYETNHCAEWDGEIPEDYDPEDSATWPVLPIRTVPLPTDSPGTGIVMVSDFRWNCRAGCPA